MSASKKIWDESFQQQRETESYNLVPPEALVRTISYYLRARYQPGEYKNLHFLDVGCGTGATLLWLARKGVRVSGLDISSEALGLCRDNILSWATLEELSRVMPLYQGSIAGRALWDDETFDGITTANILQHLSKEERSAAFAEIGRLLKPGGCLVCYEMSVDHDAFALHRSRQLSEDAGTIVFDREDDPLGKVGTTHFFMGSVDPTLGDALDEWDAALREFSSVDPCLISYDIPLEESRRRGGMRYCVFSCVLAIK